MLYHSKTSKLVEVTDLRFVVPPVGHRCFQLLTFLRLVNTLALFYLGSLLLLTSASSSEIFI